MEISGCSISCAARLVSGLGTPEAFIKLISPSVPPTGKGSRAFLFSDVVGGRGSRIAEFIVSKGLGSLTETPTFLNGNYGYPGAPLKVWVFIPDLEAINTVLAEINGKEVRA